MNFYQFPSEVKPGFITPELAQHLTVLFRECQRILNMTFSPPLHDADLFGNRCITVQTDSMFGPGGTYEFGPDATVNFDQGDTVNFGSATQTETTTINVYGANGFLTTWNWQNFSANIYVSGSTSTYNSGSTLNLSGTVNFQSTSITIWAASASLTFNNTPVYNLGLTLAATAKWPNAPANGFFMVLGCGLAIQLCGTTGVIPTITMSPLLKTAQIFLPMTSSGTGTRTDDSPYQINLTDVGSNVNSTAMNLGTAALFTGTAGQALVTTALPSWNGQTALTVFARFKINNLHAGTTDNFIVEKGTSGGSQVFQLFFESPLLDGQCRLTFTVNTSGGSFTVSTAANTIFAGVEYAAMCWYDATAQTVNINLNGTTYTTSAIGAGTTLVDSLLQRFVVGNDTAYDLPSPSLDGAVQNVFVSLAVPTAADLTTWQGGVGYPVPGGPGQFIKNLSTGATVDTIHEADNSPGAKMAVQAALGGV